MRLQHTVHQSTREADATSACPLSPAKGQMSPHIRQDHWAFKNRVTNGQRGGGGSSKSGELGTIESNAEDRADGDVAARC